jgi:uncharacterized repeat protein (TIGR03803 family)
MMLPTQAETFSVLYSFKGPPDGQSPTGGIIRDRTGNIYGITYGGGASYEGTAFELSFSGKESVLYSFLAGYGVYPESAIVRDARGNLYSTTVYGGAYNQGAVFKIDTKGNETVLYSFRGAVKTFGFNPNAVILDEQGNLYGTTVIGVKAGGCLGYGCGIVFKLDPAGKETVFVQLQGREGRRLSFRTHCARRSRELVRRDCGWRRPQLLCAFRLWNGFQVGSNRQGNCAAPFHWHGRRRGTTLVGPGP